MENFTGVLDTRQDIELVKANWNISELVAESAPLNWKKKTAPELPHYPVWNQSKTSACVGFAKARQVSIRVFNLTGVWIDFSPASIYQLRANKPKGGMNIADANDIVNTQGVTLEALMKSQNLNETQINAVERTDVADLLAKGMAEAVVSYFYVPANIDRIAQTIEAGKAVSMLLFANSNEYSRAIPQVLDPNLTYENAPIRHEIVGVDYFLDSNGVKRIYINDSAHFGGFVTRELTEDFIEKRVILAEAIDIFSFNKDVPETPKPRYDGSIISLQKCLQYEGLFPKNVAFVENFGPITQKAVMQFQVKYGLHPTGVPTVGPKTITKLKELYP